MVDAVACGRAARKMAADRKRSRLQNEAHEISHEIVDRNVDDMGDG